jgi:hypothetical protein
MCRVQPRKRKKTTRRYIQFDPIDAAGEVVVRAGPVEGHENPDWLVGAN